MVTKLIFPLVRFFIRWMPAFIQNRRFGKKALNKGYKFLAKSSPSGLIQVSFRSGSLAGKNFWLHFKNENFLWLDTYEPDLQQAIKDMVKPGMIAYDIGANYGLTAMILALSVHNTGRVFAFEPLPKNMVRLQLNLKSNSEITNVIFVPKAVTDKSSSVTFQVHKSFAMGKVQGSEGRPETFVENITVPSVALDDFIYNENNPIPQVIKLDIEGGEVLALNGMPRVLSEAKPIIFLEIHGESVLKSCWKILSSGGYTIHELEPGYPLAEIEAPIEYTHRFLARPPA